MPEWTPPNSALNEVGADFLRVGERIVDLGARRLVDAAPGQRLTPKAIAVLLELAQAQRRTLSLDQLLDRVWTGTCPTIDAVRQVVRELRRAFDDDSGTPRYIETIAKVGYRLIADCQFLDSTADAMPILDEAAPAVVTVAPASLDGSIVGCRAPGPQRWPDLSPDGRRVVYVATGDDGGAEIHLRSASGGEPTVLARGGNADLGFPVWSRSGNEIAYCRWTASAGGCIVIVSQLDGEEHHYPLPELVGLTAPEWFPDEQSLLLSLPVAATTNQHRLYRLNRSTGRMDTHGSTDPMARGPQRPRLSPDGRWLAVTRGDPAAAELWLLPASGVLEKGRPLTSMQRPVDGHAWLPDGQGLVFSSPRNGRPALHLIELADLNIRFLDVIDAIHPTVAPDGAVLYQQICRRTALLNLHSDRMSLDGDGRCLPPSGTGHDRFPAFSPDGRHLAFISDRSGHDQVWLLDRRDGSCFAMSRFRGGELGHPSWDPSGRRLLVAVRGDDGCRLHLADVQQRSINKLLSDARSVRSTAFDHEGRGLWLTLDDAATPKLYRLDLEHGAIELCTDDRGDAIAADQLDVRAGDPGLYYRRPDDDSLWYYDPARRCRSQLELPFRAWQWRVSTDGVELLCRSHQHGIEPWRYEFESRQTRRLRQPPGNSVRTLVTSTRADCDPASGQWIGSVVTRCHDEIASIRLDALIRRASSAYCY